MEDVVNDLKQLYRSDGFYSAFQKKKGLHAGGDKGHCCFMFFDASLSLKVFTMVVRPILRPFFMYF